MSFTIPSSFRTSSIARKDTSDLSLSFSYVNVVLSVFFMLFRQYVSSSLHPFLTTSITSFTHIRFTCYRSCDSSVLFEPFHAKILAIAGDTGIHIAAPPFHWEIELPKQNYAVVIMNFYHPQPRVLFINL